MSYAIVRIAKISTWGNLGASAAHTYRVLPTPNADPFKLGLNRVLVGTPGDVVADVRRRVEAVTDKPRSNAVLAIEHLLTASPQWFVGKTEAEITEWAERNIVWLRARYGADNVIHAVLHRDESTPHIVAFVVPELGGRLNARGLVGGKAQLAAMQTSYANDMDKFGMRRGVPGSKAKHQRVRRFYGQVNAIGDKAVQTIERLAEPTPPPSIIRTIVEGRRKAVGGWQRVERVRISNLVEKATSAALAASTLHQQVEDLKRANMRLTEENDNLRQGLDRAFESLGLTREDIAILRRSDMSLVAQRLGHMGEVGPKENAIDLVRRVGEFTYEQAVAWLHSEVGAALTGAMVAKDVVSKDAPKPFTPADNSIKAAVVKQTAALGCDKYRVSIVPEVEGAKPYLPGKPGGAQSQERFYTRNDLVTMIPWLRYENNQGKNIFITPMDENAYYILLDDARVTAEELEKKGFQPCLVQRTSWEKEQLVFKVPKDLPRDAVIEIFNKMNQTMGDEKMTGLRHPFRLAGFRNMKPKHIRDGQRPFVTITKAVQRFCERCTAMVKTVAARSHPNQPGLQLPPP